MKLESLILARSMEGAEALARLASMDVTSLVDEHLTTQTRDKVAATSWHDILIECDVTDLDWLRDALSLARSGAGPATKIHLVVRPGPSSHILEDPAAQSLSGWLASGVAVQGDIISVRVEPSSEETGVATTLESLQGALQVSEMLRLIANPASEGLPEFEYRPAMVMAYLREAPRVHAELEEMRAALRESTASQTREGERTDGSRRRGNATRSGDNSSVPIVLGVGGRRPRDRGLLVLLLATVLLVAGAVVGVAFGEADLGVVLTALVLAAVFFLAIDVRRRSMRLHSAIRSMVAASAKRDETSKRLLIKTSDRMRGSVARIAADVSRLGSLSRSNADALRRVLAQIESPLNVARHEQTDRAIREIRETQGALQRDISTTYRQLEAHLQLRDLISVTGPTPPLRGWAASPDVIAFLVRETRRLQPELILECGSGASTVWLAMACRSAGLSTHIVSLEHDPGFAAETERLLSDCGVEDVAEVRLAPLESVELGSYEGLWYSQSAITDLQNIGLVFVDGPPGTTAPMARYPALPILRPRLAPGAVLVLDDLIRDEEKETVARWREEFPELLIDRHSFEKGAAVVRLSGHSTGNAE